MTCHEFVVALSTIDRPTASLAAHARDCVDCGRLWRAELSLRAGKPLAREPVASPALQRLFVEHPVPVRATHPLRRLLWVLAAVAACVAFGLWRMPRADLHVATTASLVLPFAAFLSLLLAGLHLYAYRGRSGLGFAPWLRWAFAAFGVAFFEGMIALQVAQGATWSSNAEGTRIAASHDCLPLGLLVASFVGAVAFVVGRRTVLVGATSSGALAGSVAGLGALMFLHVHCAAFAGRHLAIAHVLPLLCAIGVGALIGRRVLAA